MKILQIFGAVVAVHLLAFIFIFASPGCQSGPRNIPTPDATVPTGGTAAAPVSFSIAQPPVDLGTPPATYTPASGSGYAAPTRPGSAAAVAVTPAKPASNVASVNTYTVVRGDSLWSVAKKHGMTVPELAKFNNMSTGTALQPGKKLMIPVKAGAAPAATAPATSDKPRDLGTLAQAPKPAANGAPVTHTVQPGEPLSVIAKKYQVTLGELAAANNITDPQKVRAGQVLTIPGFKAVTAKGTTTASPAPAKTAAAEIPAVSTTATPPVHRFEIAPPPPGQDLDAGLKDKPAEVPTIKVEETPPTPKH